MGHSALRSVAVPILFLLARGVTLGTPRQYVGQRAREYFVSYYSRQYAVSEEWVRAIIKVESNWEPLPVSPKGAVGVMQLMPATARRFGVQNRFDSATNIEGGVRYLRWLLDYFQGDRALATAAYFTGEGRIAGRNIRDFSPEVLAYVKKVYSL
jgi:soluble lytic murein transglycosylase-like protein